jgi:hypothetical protein
MSGKDPKQGMQVHTHTKGIQVERMQEKLIRAII